MAQETSVNAEEIWAYHLGGTPHKEIAVSLGCSLREVRDAVEARSRTLTAADKRMLAFELYLTFADLPETERTRRITDLLGYRRKFDAKRDIKVERQRLALEYRAQGMPYAVIAEELGYVGRTGKPNRGSAYKAVQKALREVLREPAEEFADLMKHRLNRMLEAFYPKALSGDPYAVDKVITLTREYARYMGITPELNVKHSGKVTHDHGGTIVLKTWQDLLAEAFGERGVAETVSDWITNDHSDEDDAANVDPSTGIAG